MTLLIVLGWAALFAVCFFISAALHGVASNSRNARKQLSEMGFASTGPLAVGQPVFFRARPCCPAGVVIEAAFSQIPALHYHTRVDAYHGRSSETVLDRTETASFYLMMGGQRIETKPADTTINWLTVQVNAYHGLAGRMTTQQKKRLIRLGVEAIASAANPMRAISVEEDLLPQVDEIWVYGSISPKYDCSEDQGHAARPVSSFVLQKPSEFSDIIIAASEENLVQQLRYQEIINFTAVIFILFMPIFLLSISFIL